MVKVRAAAYIRVSTEEQAELSPESQLSEIRKYAEREGIELLEDHIYIDAGISGKRAENRPEFMRMIAAAKDAEKPFTVILLWKYSRFARNQEESIFYKSILRSRCGIEVLSVTEPLISGPFGVLIERIIEWMDEFYSIRLSQEVKRSMRINAEQGKLQCSAAFGYEVRDGMLHPRAEEAPLVRRIFDSFVSGKGTYAIARELNEAGARTHRGNKFESRTVEYILRNPVYIGKLRWNPAGHTGRDFGNENLIISDGRHEALISEETFALAQELLTRAKRRPPNRAAASNALKSRLSGIVRCSECGSALVFSKPCYYKCGGYSNGRCRVSQHVQASLLEDALFSRLAADSSMAAELGFEVCSAGDSNSPNEADMQAALRQLEARRARLLEAYLDGAVDLGAFSEECRKLDADIQREKAKLEKASLELSLDVQAVSDAAETALRTLSSPLPDNERVNSALRAIIDSCTFDRSAPRLVIIYDLDLRQLQ